MNAGPVDHDLDLEVVVPVRWDGAVDDRTDRDFTHHLSRLATLCDVTVVDGSQGPEADERRHRWSSCARVLRPDPRWHGPNGKVSGAVTGVVAARHPKVVIADDDVRHDESTLRARLRWTPTDATSLDVTAIGFDSDNGYDAWSLDHTRQTLSDRPGRDDLDLSSLGLTGRVDRVAAPPR